MLWQECFISLHYAKLASANLATYQIEVNDHHWLTFFFSKRDLGWDNVKLLQYVFITNPPLALCERSKGLGFTWV